MMPPAVLLEASGLIHASMEYESDPFGSVICAASEENRHVLPSSVYSSSLLKIG